MFSNLSLYYHGVSQLRSADYLNKIRWTLISQQQQACISYGDPCLSSIYRCMCVPYCGRAAAGLAGYRLPSRKKGWENWWLFCQLGS